MLPAAIRRPLTITTWVVLSLLSLALSPLLLVDAWGRYPGQRTYVDVPVENTAATRIAEAHGLTVQRYLTRMCRGPACRERLAWLAATFGPEKG